MFLSLEVHWTVLSFSQKMNRSILTSSRSQWLQLAERWFLAVGDDILLLCFSKAERICKIKVDLNLCIRCVNRNDGESFRLDEMLRTMTCNKTLLVNTKKNPYIFKHRSCDFTVQNFTIFPFKQQQQKRWNADIFQLTEE